MNPPSPDVLWIAALAIVVGGAVACGFILLRTPLALLNLRTRVEAIEHAMALMDATVKKAARRAGVEERRRRKAAEEEEGSEEGLELAPRPRPNGPPAGSDKEAQLAHLRNLIRQAQGG